MNAPRIIIIADDLTGALDAAAPFAKRGLLTRVVALPGADTEAVAPALEGAQVVAVNTESRHLDASSAAAAVRSAVQRHAHAEAILFKKVDSTLRGNVAAETLAAQQASARRAVIFAPAFPAQGRITRGGVVYVHGVPLAQTEFVRDALSPAPREPIAAFMRQAAPDWNIELATPRTLAVKGSTDPAVRVTLNIVDAQTQDELDAIVNALRARLSDYVLVGSAGLSTALVAAASTASHTTARARASGITLFIVGSRAQKSRAQAAALSARAETLTLEAPNGEVNERALQDALRALPAQGSLLILATQPPAAAAPAELVAQRLAQLCLRMLSACEVRAVVATGGDTAKAILEATRNPIIAVRDELMPGIALAAFAHNSQEYRFVTKAGAFGQDNTFIGICEAL